MAVQRPSVCEGFQSASSARSRSGGSAPQLSKVKVTQQVSQSRTSTRRSSGESHPKSKSPPASNHGVGRLFLGKAPSQKKDGYFPPSAVEARLRATKTLLSPVLSLSGTTTPTKEFHCENPRARSSPQSVPRSTGATTRTSSLKHRPVGRVLAPPRQKYPGRFTPVKAAMPKASQRAAPNQAASGNEAEHVDVTCSEPVEFVVESAMAEGRVSSPEAEHVDVTCSEPVEFVVESAMAEGRVSSPEARVGKDEHTMDEELGCSGVYHGQQSRGCEEDEQCVTVSPENEHLTEATEEPLAEARRQHDLRDTEGEDDEEERFKQVHRVRPRIHTALHSQAQAAVVMMEDFSPRAADEQDVGAWASVPLLKGHRHSTGDVAAMAQKDDSASRRARSASASMPSVHVEEDEQRVTASPENEHLTEATEEPLAEARGQHDLRDTEGEDDEEERFKQVHRVRPRIHTALHSQAQAAVVMMEDFSPRAADEQDVGAWASVPLLKGHRHSTGDVAAMAQKDDSASRRARSASASMPSVHVEDEPEARAAAQCHETRSQALRGNAREERHLVEDPVADAAEALAAEDAEDDEKQKQIAAYRKRGRAHTALHSQAQLAVDSVFPTWEEPTCGGPWAQCQVPAVSEARHSMCEISLEREEFVPRRLRAGTLPSSLGKDWGALSKMSAVDFKSSSTRTLTPRRVDNDSGPTTPRIEGSIETVRLREQRPDATLRLGNTGGLGFGGSVLSTRTLSPRARTASSASSPCTSPRGLHGLEARSRTLPPSAEDSVACRLSRENSAETLASMVSIRTLTPLKRDVSTRTLSPREGAMSESRGDSALGRDVVCASALSSEVYDRKSLLMDRESPSSRTSGVEKISLDPDAQQDVEQARAE